jgi:hypothetical protein
MRSLSVAIAFFLLIAFGMSAYAQMTQTGMGKAAHGAP